MLRKEKFKPAAWGLVEAADTQKDALFIKLEELDGCRIYSHFFEMDTLEDAREKIQWLLDNTGCYEVVLFYKEYNPVTWRGKISDHEWNYYYGEVNI